MHSLEKIYVLKFNDGFEPIMTVEEVKEFNIKYDSKDFVIRTEPYFYWNSENYFTTMKRVRDLEKSGHTEIWTTNGKVARDCLKILRSEWRI